MSAPLWSFEEFLAALNGRPVGPAPLSLSGISIDSRTVGPGEAFFAIRGERFDGHDFVGRALAGGAATAVVGEERLAGLGRITGSMVVVDDVLAALERLGRAARARSRARIAAITGSVGKTGTKEMLMRALAPAGRVHGSSGSFNNHWGVPLTLARMPADAAFGVFEIGMNHAGEITPLVAMVRPHVAIVTTVEAVHLEHFRSVEAIGRAKAEIFTGLEPGGVAVLNRDNAQFGLLCRLAVEAGVERVVSFGEHADADVRLDAVALHAEGSTVSARLGDRAISYSLAAPGRHIVQNSLAVLAAVAELGADPAAATAAFGAMVAYKGRGDRHRLAVGQGTALLIDESYNANPASMRAAIGILGQAQPGAGGRRIAVLGDMLELGAEEMAMHAELAEPLAEARVDLVFAAGPRMAALWEALPEAVRGAYAGSAAELEPILLESLRPGDVVMVKGSNGSRMVPLAERLKETLKPVPDAAAAAGGKAPPGQGSV